MDTDSKILKWMEDKLMGPMSKIAQYKLVRAIMAAGVATIPFTIIGSMFLVFNILPQTFPFLEGFFEATFFKISDLYMLANSATMGILALYFNIVLAYEFTRLYAEEDNLDMSPLSGVLLSLFAFVMTIPQLIVENGTITRLTEITEDINIINGWEIGGDGVVRFGTDGIFTGILVAILAVQLYRLCVSRDWIIKMPEQVPSGVSRAFSGLIPGFVIALVVMTIMGVLAYLGTDIYEMVAIPFGFVSDITGSWIGVVLIFFIIQALWIIGIHGANIIIPLIQPILLGNLALNATQGASEPLAGAFPKMFVEIGGSGATLGLVIYIAFMAKSKQLKTIGKAGLIPSIFNINEPIIFGLPLIFNPYLAIPFILAPLVTASIGYFALSTGFVNPIIAQTPWPLPVGINAFIGTGGDWKGALVSLFCLLVAFLIYLPFIKSYDKQLVEEEQENIATENN